MKKLFLILFSLFLIYGSTVYADCTVVVGQTVAWGEGGDDISFIEDSIGSGSGTSVEVSYPTGISYGDLLIAYVIFDANTTITWPSNWTQDQGLSNSSSILYSGYRVYTSGDDASLTFTAGTSTNIVAVVMAFEKSSGSWSIAASDYTTETGTTITEDCGSVAGGDMLVIGYSNDGQMTISSAPSDPVMTTAEGANISTVSLYTYYHYFETTDSDVQQSVTWSGSEDITSISMEISID